ncbi:hypothetical protein A3H65_03960 [Candidatus Giovannonibacteria bacterium RIFCSPLOWO2_02_FULL_45_14]|uniref:Glycosyl transferase family 1 domain-containing protein n=1 Tax=Candidatus Giovannonibacteria bacterium RIFCSPLOWO2_12_FULL_44_15 TaxID=1798364 RepID=A0A1F5Y0S2_9BACT|nr:MAG: hypothetical protein A3C75_00345 [Candidatus Giovannonibacteria bacterium RIFCSPHIGHO2_02_FULL_44_31]OGF76753.1 MAG: hypothetical protein A3E62_02780 [Candidatus Giovannonibacteria bacterium RIFCSPHIGHO2_12_FULL_44_29]OGF91218.1 MAG: hypothetical protein A3H65_03960 [Candidatus Giovannonibacteria bacterium RIFCSPLOWO2_02_FULL_45_14]OGF93764.1 MAG: hypothetical protein A3G54_02450 [Candidatus Giovannonibacteria bacterium RIFCSPLOWO2_12_FULL_44_15]
MRILIATGIYPPDVGGPAGYSALLEKELPKRGVAVKILSFGWYRGYLKILRHFIYFLRVIKLGRDCDIIYAQDPVSVGLPAIFASKYLGKKFAIKIVGDYAWEQGIQRFGVKELLDEFLEKKYGFAVEFLKKIERYVARNSSAVIVPSNYLAQVLKKWGVAADKINVIYNTVSAHALPRNKAKENILFSAGRNVPWKGFEMLNELQIPNAKMITGSFPKEEYEKLLSSSAIFLLNTGYEGFSHQILEAMALGLPIITTNAGGNKEIVENEKNALVVEYNNKEAWTRAITRLLNDENLQKRLSEGAKTTAQKFLSKDMINETIKVLESILHAK